MGNYKKIFFIVTVILNVVYDKDFSCCFCLKWQLVF